MYDTQAEDKFLSYATYMLLDRTKKSSDYTEPIFADPLPNAKFSDSYANIDTSWRNTAAMTPLFVPTQHSQSQVRVVLLHLCFSSSYIPHANIRHTLPYTGYAARRDVGRRRTASNTVHLRFQHDFGWGSTWNSIAVRRGSELELDFALQKHHCAGLGRSRSVSAVSGWLKKSVGT